MLMLLCWLGMSVSLLSAPSLLFFVMLQCVANVLLSLLVVGVSCVIGDCAVGVAVFVVHNIRDYVDDSYGVCGVSVVVGVVVVDMLMAFVLLLLLPVLLPVVMLVILLLVLVIMMVLVMLICLSMRSFMPVLVFLSSLSLILIAIMVLVRMLLCAWW